MTIKHCDSDGIERVGNQWGFNSFVALEGAEQSVRRHGLRGTRWYIWRLADGTYDWTACNTLDIPDDQQIPGHPVELVNIVDV